MLKKLLIIFLILFVGRFIWGVEKVAGKSLISTSDIVTLKNGNDFATELLKNPWDMDDFSDISQWFNHVSDDNMLINYSVSDGVFTATTKGDYSEFYMLFPGYQPGLLHGKIGALNPINSENYKCFYISMRENNDTSFQISWAKDKDFVLGTSPTGQTHGMYWEDSSYYKIFKVNLSTYEKIYNYTWTSFSEWQMLKFIPSMVPNTTFNIDWIRLTDCNPVYFEINGLEGNQEYEIWLEVGSTGRMVLAESNAVTESSGVYRFDTQGLEANTYTFFVKKSGNTIQQGQFIVNAVPNADILRPSMTSGEDFATSAGAPWDMSGLEDVWDIRCAAYNFSGGILNLYTDPRQCASSAGDNEADPKVFLSMPNGEYARPSDFRYLSLRMYQNGDYSAPDLGMIGRWMWTVRDDGKLCTYVSREVSLDVGWHTYKIDFFNDYNGMPVGSDYCTPDKLWENFTNDNASFRFDPNENVMDFTFHQQIDWIKLTKVDETVIGSPYVIEYVPSEDGLNSLDFYYTDDLSNPTKYPVIEYISNTTPGNFPGPYFVYLPVVLKNQVVYHNPTIKWDTSGVNAGEYYICAVADDGLNTSVNCSEAPIKVISE